MLWLATQREFSYRLRTARCGSISRSRREPASPKPSPADSKTTAANRHWGYIVSGTLTVTYSDESEEVADRGHVLLAARPYPPG